MGEKKQPSATEWPKNPPLRRGQGEELRDIAAPGDDTVFEANEREAKRDASKSDSSDDLTAKRSRKDPRSANDDRSRADDDAAHSRTER